MGIEYHVSDEPRFVPVTYKSSLKKPYKRIGGSQDWYKGTGVPPESHPLTNRIDFSNCEACNSRDVLVIAAQFCVHLYSGDQYFDYELACNSCQKFTRVSYCEN